MKKYISIILTFIFTFSIIATASAESTTNKPVTFIESMENLLKFSNYKSTEKFFGGLKVSTYGKDNINGSFGLSVTSSNYKKANYEFDGDSYIQGSIVLYDNSKDKSFDQLICNVRGKLIYIVNDGLYGRLDDINILARGIPKSDEASYNNFQKSFKKEISKIKGKWYYLPTGDLTTLNEDAYAELPEEFRKYADQKALMKELKEKGLKKFYADLVKDLIDNLKDDMGITESEVKIYKQVIDDFFATQFFGKRKVESGEFKGQTSFNLNKFSVINFVKKIAGGLNEEMSVQDIASLKYYLNLFSLSGFYHEDFVNRIIDQFRVTFTLKNIQNLEKFEVAYSQQISDINTLKGIEKPSSFTSLEKTINDLNTSYMGF